MPPTEGDDILFDTSGDDAIDALGGNDTITVTSGFDLITGGSGSDRLIVDYSTVSTAVINGVPTAGYTGRFQTTGRAVDFTGIELLTILTGSGNDIINAGGGNDTINTGAGTDIIDGGAGADYINGGAGADQMTGYLGDDNYVIDDSGDVIVEGLLEGFDSAYASISYALGALAYVEVLSTDNWADTGAIDLTGNSINNRLYGNAGVNVLNGMGGADRMEGFGGDDVYYVDNAGDVVNETAGQGTDTVYITVGWAAPRQSSIEVIRVLDPNSTNTVFISAPDNVNFLYGNNGSNSFSSNGGGATTMTGYLGNDTYHFHAGDTVVEADGEGFDKIITVGVFVLAAGVSIEEIEWAEAGPNPAANFTGNEFDQHLIGGTKADTLNGKGGADTLEGKGDDDVYITDSLDTIIDTFGYDTAYVAEDYVLSDASLVEVLSTVDWGATDAFDLTGNNLANQIYGNTGDNIIDGQEGSDQLVGFLGQDSFAFTTALGASNIDRIFDFVAANDTILLDDAIFTTLTAGALPAGAFVVGTAAGDADDRILYNSATGALFYDADGNAGGAAVQFATLSSLPTITASDFTVI